MKFKNIIYDEKFYNRHVEPFFKRRIFERIKRRIVFQKKLQQSRNPDCGDRRDQTQLQSGHARFPDQTRSAQSGNPVLHRNRKRFTEHGRSIKIHLNLKFKTLQGESPWDY